MTTQRVRIHADPLVKSYLTGSDIAANRYDDAFAVPKTSWSLEAVADAITLWQRIWSKRARTQAPSSHLRSLVESLVNAPEIGAFVALLDDLLSRESEWGESKLDNEHFRSLPWRASDKQRVKELCVALWSRDLLLWPRGQKAHFRRAIITLEMLQDCGRDAIVRPWFAFIPPDTPYHSSRRWVHGVARVPLSYGFVREIGDLTPDVVGDHLSIAHVELRKPLRRSLPEAQKSLYGESVVHTAANYYESIRTNWAKRSTAGREFMWACEIDPALSEWQHLASAYLADAVRGKPHIVYSLNTFLQYLLDNPTVTRSPLHFLRKTYEAPAQFDNVVRIKTANDKSTNAGRVQNAVHTFIEWILDTRFAEEDEDGAKVRLPGLRNPLKRASVPGSRPESIREAIPTRLIRWLIEILTENDWEWARKAGEAKAVGGDWIHRKNPSTGEWEDVWSPVRSTALYVKLRMPFRTHQVRFVDSGEADTFIFDLKHGWIKNNGPLASGTAREPVQKGVVQMIGVNGKTDRLPILRINTNKTADIGKEGWQRGYDCPYAPEDVIEKLCALRDWQSANNPLPEPTDWSSVEEVRQKKTEVEVEGLRSCFLFRDPTAENPYDPITSPKVQKLWLKLVDELDCRLKAAGVTTLDGNPYELFYDRDQAGRPTRLRYDLHSLRVSLITAYYETGKVSAEVLMKIVGHSTVVMTLYYTKLGIEYIQAAMTEASAELLNREQQQWINHQRSQSLISLSATVAYNDGAGLAAFAEGSGNGLLDLPIGVCAAGGSACLLGGAPVGDRDPPVYGPVPGLRRNCAGCRFVISGPPFLFGVQAEFNARSFQASDLSSHREKVETRFEELDAQRRAAERAGEPFTAQREWARSSADLEDVTRRLDQLGLEMANLGALDAQIKEIIAHERGADGDGRSLIAGDIETVLSVIEESTDFELADRVCQSSVFYPSIVPRDANRLRINRYNQMLRRNGLQPAFLDMDEDTALYVGNELTKHLMSRIGRQNTLRLIDGQETIHSLERLGIFSADLAAEISSRLSLRSVEGASLRLAIAAPSVVSDTLASA